MKCLVAFDEAQPVPIASASTVNIGAAKSNTIYVSGTTTITSFGTIAAGAVRTTVFTGVLTLTHNATSLVLPWGANRTTAAGDIYVWRSLGGGNWTCVSFVPASGLGTAATFNVTTSPTDTTPNRLLKVGDYNLGVASFSKNKIINGNPLVNQLSLSGTVTLAAGAYGHDGWKAGASGCTYTFATTANLTTFTITAGSLQQVIEGLNLQSGPYCLSWLGTAQGKIGAGSYSASGVTSSVTGGANLTIEFNTGTLTLAQFEVGAVATPFEHRHYAQELALCHRYYWEVPAGRAIYGTTAAFSAEISFPVPMRVPPAMTSPLTDANFVSSTAPASGQWAMQVAGISVTSKTGAFTTGLTATSSVNSTTLYGFGATLSNSPNLLVSNGLSFKFSARL